MQRQTNMKIKFSLLPMLESSSWNLHKTCRLPSFVFKGTCIFSLGLSCTVLVWQSLFCLLLAVSPIDGGHFEFWNSSPGICLPCLVLFPGTDFWFVNFPSSSCEIAEDVQEVHCLQAICHCFLTEKLSLLVHFETQISLWGPEIAKYVGKGLSCTLLTLECKLQGYLMQRLS